MIRNDGSADLRKLIKGNEAAVLAGIEQELYDFGEDVRAAVIQYLDDEGINVQGDIRDSINYEVAREIGRMRISVGSNSDHAIFVHEGTKPHWPPVDPIKKWAIRKLNIKGKELLKATWFIRKKIATVGTDPKPFLTTPFYLYSKELPRRIADRIKKSVVN